MFIMKLSNYILCTYPKILNFSVFVCFYKKKSGSSRLVLAELKPNLKIQLIILVYRHIKYIECVSDYIEDYFFNFWTKKVT